MEVEVKVERGRYFRAGHGEKILRTVVIEPSTEV